MTTNLARYGVLTLSAAALAACSTSGSGTALLTTKTSSAAARPSATAPVTPADSPATSDTPTSAPSSAGPSDDGSAARLLITSGEVGGDFASVTGDQTDTPLPCTPDQPGPLAQVPSVSHAQVDFATPQQDITITERVIRYADDGGAQQVLDVVHRGFGCASANLGGATLQIAGPNDVRSSVVANVDQADDWTLRSEAGNAELIVVRAGSTVVQIVFTATPGASIQIDPAQVVRTAVAKAINGG